MTDGNYRPTDSPNAAQSPGIRQPPDALDWDFLDPNDDASLPEPDDFWAEPYDDWLGED